MDEMFLNATSFNEPVNMWNTVSLTSLIATFEGASSFNQNLRGWDVGGVLTFERMFKNAIIFNRDIKSWNVKENAIFTDMFLGATQMILTYSGTQGFGTTPTYDFWQLEDFSELPIPHNPPQKDVLIFNKKYFL